MNTEIKPPDFTTRHIVYCLIHNLLFAGSLVMIGAGIWMWLGTAAGLVASGVLLLFALVIAGKMRETAQKQLEQRRIAQRLEQERAKKYGPKPQLERLVD